MSTANIAYKYRKLKLKLLTTLEDIKFNKSCKEQKLKPNYIQIQIKNKSKAAQLAKQAAEKIWLNQEINFLYHKVHLINSQLAKLHLQLFNHFHFIEIEAFFENIESWLGKQIDMKRKCLKNKIQKLQDVQSLSRPNTSYSEHRFYPRLINKTNIQLEKDEVELLNKGLNYCIPQNNIRNLLIDTETTILTLPKDMQNQTRILAHNKITKNINKPKPKNYKKDIETIQKIKHKLETNNASITKADKGNTVVIVDNIEHDKKVIDFIHKNNIKKLPKDPTAIFHEQLKTKINKSKLLTDTQKLYCRTIKPNAPKLRGLPKLHKPDEPIRPLVNFINCPSYKISKILDKIIRQNLQLENDKSIKNSSDLINKIKEQTTSSTQLLVSFDIQNLYTNIPIDETVDIIKQNLLKQGKDRTYINDLLELLTLVLKQNYFEYNNNFYSQETGLAMGSPLSAIIAEIFLNHIENNHILDKSKNKQADKILQYHRYADDIFCIFQGNKRQIQILTNFLNNIHPNLKFTTELEHNNSINYLDLTISKENSCLKFKIYRKPTATDQVIHESSNHPTSHKLAAFHSMINRLLTTPLKNDDYQQEVNTIKQIAINNGYTPQLINKLIWKHKTKETNRQPSSNKFIAANYHGKINNSLHNLYTKQGYKIAYKSINSISNILKQIPKPTNTDKFEGTGVYKITCATCPKFYIGQTGRSFNQRYKEHLPKKNLNRLTTFSEHIINENHSYSTIDKSLEIIQHAPKSTRLDTIEHFHIYKATKQQPSLILNDQKNFSANVIFDALMNSRK